MLHYKCIVYIVILEHAWMYWEWPLKTSSQAILPLCRDTNSVSSWKRPGFLITGRWHRRRNEEFVSGLSAVTLNLGLTYYDGKIILNVPKYCGLGKYLDKLSYGERHDISTSKVKSLFRAGELEFRNMARTPERWELMTKSWSQDLTGRENLGELGACSYGVMLTDSLYSELYPLGDSVNTVGVSWVTYKVRNFSTFWVRVTS